MTDTAARGSTLTAETIRSRDEARLADTRERLARLEAAPPADRTALLCAVDGLHLALANASSAVGVLKEVHPDVAAREACEAGRPYSFDAFRERLARSG